MKTSIQSTTCRKTFDDEKKLHSYELEVLAIVMVHKKFRMYLQGLKFKLVTDCEAFKKTHRVTRAV